MSSSTFKKATLTIGTFILLSTLGAAPAFAKACKNVHLEVKNTTGQTIEIIDLDYWDSESEKWRSEPIPNETIRNNRTWQANRNLERVNGQSVKIKVKYKHKKKHWNKLLKRWKWKTVKSTHTSSSKTCRRNAEYIMSIR